MKNGQIGVTTENIFPVIKKFLYSDQEIFLREMVSNAIDATQKFKTVCSTNDEEIPEYKDEDLKVWVSVDEENGTITIKDHGIGMTEEEIDKYINQIAFSGLSDFIEKYKDNAASIIGHFGLGFYSSFMVSKKVEIITKSYKKDSKLVKWSCDGNPEYTLEEIEDDGRQFGTEIILYLDDESKEEFGKKNKIKELLDKYCKFLAVPVVFGKKTKWDSEQKKNVETEEDNLINPDEPLWKKKPADLADDDYKKFFRSLYPGEQEPLFWIHLNVSEPFELTGILFMPPSKNQQYVLKKHTVKLYCNNVFVTDEVDDFVPDFLQLLYGVIDSPDIPLNVSRSYLQSDKNVKKISGYIQKKVADRLKSVFKDDRKKFEGLWDDMRLFVNYGIISEDSFYDRAKDFYMFKNTDGKYFSMDEYKSLIEANQKDKNDNLVYLYATNTIEQGSYIETAKDKGYDVLLLDNQLDILAIETLEQKMEKVKFAKVDSATVNKLIDKGDAEEVKDDADDIELLRSLFMSHLKGEQNGRYYNVQTEHMGEDVLPVVVLQNEWSSRQKANKRFQSGMFWGGNTENYTLTLNTDHELVKNLWNSAKNDLTETLKPVNEEIATAKENLSAVENELKDVKWEDRSDEQKKKLDDAFSAQQNANEHRENIITEYAKDNVVVKELIEIALLSANLLTGQQLADFIKRTVSLIDVKSPKAKKAKKTVKKAEKKEPEVAEVVELN